MCGIVGVAGSLTKLEEDAIKDLLVVDSIRGEDSTGSAFINRQGGIEVVKTVGDPFQLFDTVRFGACMRQANKCIIGHNRSATVGKVVRKNAHPFEFPTLVGVHNGTLKNKYSLKESHHFDTDSEALYHNIHQYGLEQTIPEVDGAYTLVWYSSEDATINFLRNKERPLFYAFNDKQTCLFWASEIWMLMGAMHRRGIKPKEIVDLPIDIHHAFEIPLVGKEFAEPVKKEIKQKVFTKGTAECGKGTTCGTKQTATTEHPALPANGVFLKGKETIIRMVSWEKNSNGAYFINAISHEFTGKKFRIYVHSEVECKELFQNKRYRGVIGGSDSSGLNTYKINVLSLKPIVESNAPVVVTKVHQFRADHQGRMLDKEDFDKRYKSCCFCDDPIEFNTQWKALSNDACLCEACLTDETIQQYLPSLY